MAKIPFKISDLYFGDKPGGGWTDAEKVRAQGMTYEENYSELDVTDNGSTGDSVEIDTGVATRQSKINGVLRAADGTVIKGRSLAFTFDGAPVGITSAGFDEAYEEQDLTDTDTVGDGTEFDVDFAKRTIKISAWVKDTAELARNVVKAATLTLKTGVTIAGNIILTAMNIQGQAKGFFKVDYTGNYNTCVKTLPAGFPVTGVVKDCKILYKDGTTDKAAEGKAIITTLSVNSEKKGEAKFDFTLKWCGEPTTTNYVA